MKLGALEMKMMDVLRRVDELEVAPVTNTTRLIIAFDVLYIVGFVILSFTLITASVFKHVRRTATWYTVIFSWVISCVANLLLLGQQGGSPDPARALCTLQASLVHSVPAYTAWAAWALAIHVYLSLVQSNQVLSILLHAVPNGLFIMLVVILLICGVARPDFVRKNPGKMYCHFSSGTAIPKQVSGGLTIIGTLGILTIEAIIISMIFKRWRAARNFHFLRHHEALQLGRLALFSAIPVLGLIISAFQFVSKSQGEETVLIVVLASIPLLVGLIFGTQGDLFQAWTKKKPYSTSSASWQS